MTPNRIHRLFQRRRLLRQEDIRHGRNCTIHFLCTSANCKCQQKPHTIHDNSPRSPQCCALSSTSLALGWIWFATRHHTAGCATRKGYTALRATTGNYTKGAQRYEEGRLRLCELGFRPSLLPWASRTTSPVSVIIKGKLHFTSDPFSRKKQWKQAYENDFLTLKHTSSILPSFPSYNENSLTGLTPALFARLQRLEPALLDCAPLLPIADLRL